MYTADRIRTVCTIAALVVARRGDEDRLQRIFEKLIAMGGVYVKFAQILMLKVSGEKSSQATYGYLLRQAYDTTPYEDLDIVALLRAELGDTSDEIAQIYPQPVAAGSFGQVYKALLQDGQVVAIKVLRPSVRRTIRADLRLLKMLSRVLNLTGSDAYDVAKIYDRFRFVTLNELDYRREAGYAEELYRRYADHPNLVIPKTYSRLSTRHVITQSFIDGVALTEVLERHRQGMDPAVYTAQLTGSNLYHQLITIGQTMLESMLTEGSAHGDPHPGNIMLLPDNKVALLDFGIRAQAPSDKRAFFGLIKQYQKIYDDTFDLQGYTWAIVDLFVRDLTMAVRSLDMYSHGRLSEQVFAAISDAVESIYAGSARDIEQLLSGHKFLKIFNSVINQNNRFGFHVEVEQPEFMRATLLFISLTEALGVKEVVLKHVYTNVVTNFRHHQFPQTVSYTTPDQAVEIMAEWLDKVASKDIYLYQLLAKRIEWGNTYA